MSDNKIEIHFFEDLGSETTISQNGNTQITTLRGRAIGGHGGKLIVIDRRDANLGTLMHEMGHSKWGLIHPNEEFMTDPPDDFENFMHPNSTENKIRSYQFNKIHN